MVKLSDNVFHSTLLLYRFDINDNNGELHADRPVPFRLTPNIAEFMSPVGVSSVLAAAMVASARCFLQPNFKVSRSVLI